MNISTLSPSFLFSFDKTHFTHILTYYGVILFIFYESIFKTVINTVFEETPLIGIRDKIENLSNPYTNLQTTKILIYPLIFE